MKTKQIILCCLAVMASCAAVFIFAPTVMAKDEKSMLTTMETKFFQEAAGSGMGLVKMAGLADKKAEHKDIKAFATMLSKEHGKANEELKLMGTKKGVRMSDKMNPKMMDAYQKLEATEGMAFDKSFLAEVVQCHEMDIKSYQKISMDGKDPELRMFVDKMLPSLKAHHEKAKELMPK